MKAASRQITCQLTPGQYPYAEKQTAEQDYPSDEFDDLLTGYENRADRWGKHFAANGLLPAAAFEEQCEAIRMIVRGINDQFAFGVGSANDQ